MAASHTLANRRAIGKHGILVLHGFGIQVRVERGHLFCSWGIADERCTIRLPRVHHGLRRLVCIGSDGYVSLEALHWLSSQDASFLILDRRGKPLVVCGPSAPSDARLRRAQSLAFANGTALRISKAIIRQKLDGQSTLVRDMLQNAVAATAIEKFRDELPDADSIESVRIIEAQAAKQYWSAWASVPIRWPRKDERRVPEQEMLWLAHIPFNASSF